MMKLYIHSLLFILEMEQSGSLRYSLRPSALGITSETQFIHTNELYVSGSVCFQDINSLNYLVFYLNTDTPFSKAVCSWQNIALA